MVRYKFEDDKDEIILDTPDLINKLTGKNKAFISRIAKLQETKYNNKNLFTMEVYCPKENNENEDITIWFGDHYITFYYRNCKLVNTLGSGQGHKYENSLRSCADEIINKYHGQGEKLFM